MKLRSSAALSPLFVSLLLAGRGLAAVAAEKSCTAPACHETLLKAKTVHAAAEACEACHETVATPHPQKRKKTFKLAQKPAELCESCHTPFGKKAHVHPPVKDGECVSCHSPHASPEPKLLTAPLGELCVSCHPDHVEFKVVHGPVAAGACTSCHTPHESDNAALLLKPGNGVCFGCHAGVEASLKSRNVHAAMDGGCVTCHNPHGSAFPKLFAEKGATLCFQCHEDVSEKVQKGASVHAPVRSDKACATCHSGHASDQAKLLLRPERELCLGCHKAILPASMTFLHGPVKSGPCVACHDPHASPNTKLLAKGFPANPYVAYTETEFALCFGCHKRDLLASPDTSSATAFRDGQRNLHFLHVNNKLKGRSCKLCHGMHGSDNAALIAEKVPFGQWSLPLRFKKTEDGGSCSPGCHKPQAYTRAKAGSLAQPPKPAAKK